MTKYCPACFGEFKDNVSICPEDKIELTHKKPAEFDKLVDVYAASGEIEAERIITFLRDKGIDARESTKGISQLPVTGEMGFCIAVFRNEAKRAKEIIKQARKDGVISENGNFLTV